MIDENKYFSLFALKFKADIEKLKSDYHRMLSNEKGSDAAKIRFFKNEFQWIIARLKRDFSKDEHYEYIVSTTYEIFIKVLNEDGIESSSEQLELDKIHDERKSKSVSNMVTTFAPESKYYNLNTKYGRRKAREQAARNYENGSQEYKNDIDNIKAVFWIIIIVIALIVFFLKAALK